MDDMTLPSTITPTWLYLELVNKPILDALTHIAMKKRIDAGRLISHLTTSHKDELHHWEHNCLYVTCSKQLLWSYFDTESELDLWIDSIMYIYKHDETSNMACITLLSKKDALNISNTI